ncbi:hypothetical protein [Streptomyces mirabilis]|uniref:hypothetical protein n=1 Tax=Streptomyces mirabilis TaxID=68239 RepID=UPI0036DCAF62
MLRRKGEVESFDLTAPAFVDRALAAGQQVGLQLVEPGQHPGVDRQHRASDTGELMRAGRAVRASAGAEFDLALVEVLLEVTPLLVSGSAVLRRGPLGPATVEEFGVVGDDVLVEDCDVAAGGLDIEVAEQGRADVNGQAIVDQVGGEQPADVVRGEADLGELWVCGDQGLGGVVRIRRRPCPRPHG